MKKRRLNENPGQNQYQYLITQLLSRTGRNLLDQIPKNQNQKNINAVIRFQISEWNKIHLSFTKFQKVNKYKLKESAIHVKVCIEE